ncbi:hypothetical protein [Salinispora tropica]|uniref:Thioredoxin domain-containing protein n=1 Tax=Salinispora tropica (strain ATCC BAA-916 / DSM 44818 / JCM 13857 / NBRC 105044 / CNB-440) TaxID=369723 RepID=A4XCN4_SALTO|nr:hypothetical protein [Salinispora tropica]ABP56691.1 hypothetical protein Strop_4263 [Salinispora tropica CNB-440]
MGRPAADDDSGLPDLPPEWGRVVVPNNAAELSAEAEQIRRELNRPTPSGSVVPTLLALLVVMVTVLAGLSATIWAQSPPAPLASTPATPAPPTDLIGRTMPAFDLVDNGQPVPLRGLLPAVILLADACACPAEVASTVAVAPPGVTVIAINPDPAVRDAPPAPPNTLRALDDPADGLRAFLRLPPRADVVSALLVDRSGTVRKLVPELHSTADYEPELARLAN